MVTMHRRQNVCRVGTLASSFFEVALLTQLFYKKLEEAMLCLMLNHAGAKFGEHTEIETWVGQLQPQQIFDVHTRPYCICRLTICKIFHVLHKTYQPQPPRSLRWFPSSWEQVIKLAIIKNCTNNIS